MTSPFGSVVSQLLKEADGSIPYNLPEESIYLESVRGLRDELDSIVAGDPGFIVDPSTIDHDLLLNFDQDEHFLKSDITAADISMAVVSSPTFSSVQHMQDIFHSSGWVSGGVLSDVGGGDIDVSAGTGLVRATDSSTVQLLFFDWAQSLANAVTDGTARFFGIEYNDGSPQVVMKNTDTWDYTTDFPLGSAVREGSVLHISQNPHDVGDHANFMIQRMFDINKFQRDNQTGGLILGESADTNMYITVSAGNVWSKLTKTAFAAFDSDPGGGGDTFDTYKHVSGTLTLTTGVTQWPNTQYDDGNDLVTMGSNKYANLWFYGEPDGEVAMVYGVAQYTQSALAELEEPPSDLPVRIQTHSFLLGRLTFKKSDTTATQVDSVFETVFLPTQAATHSNLSGLTGDDHLQYILVAGSRAFGGNISHGGFNITNVGALAGTLSTAAQPNVTSLGTLTALQVDNININGNTISSTAGTNLLITPLGGQKIILDGAINIDAGVVTGITSLTSSNLLASSDNSGAIGASGTAFSDLFLASGGVINWNSGNMTITHVAGVLGIEGGNVVIGSTTAEQKLNLVVAASTQVAIQLLQSGQVGWRIGMSSGGRGLRFVNQSADFSTTPILYLDNSANQFVGIGTASPSALLHVAGTFLVTGTTTINTVTYTWPGSDGGSGDLLTTNGTGGLSWTAGGGGGLGGSGTAGKVSKWSATSTLTDSIISDNGSTITIAGALDLSGQIDLNTNNIIAGGTAAFTTITASAALIRGVNNSAIILSGGTSSTQGGNIVLYGESHASQDGDFEFRDDTTIKFWYDSSQSVFQINGNLKITSNIGFFNTTPLSKQTITGSRDNNAALTTLLTALAGYGLIVDSSTV